MAKVLAKEVNELQSETKVFHHRAFSKISERFAKKKMLSVLVARVRKTELTRTFNKALDPFICVDA